MRRRFMSDIKITFNKDNYMTINALEDGVRIVYDVDCEYGINNVGWYKYSQNSVVILNFGESASFRNQGYRSGRFNISGRCSLSGSVMSLLYGNDTKNKVIYFSYAFANLFRDCLGIETISSNFLPATTLATACYDSMFYGCTSLVNAPDLPATTLEDSCYYNMFQGCTSLTTAPELPATTLVSNCYVRMFRGCDKLNYIKMLATDISAHSCLYNWVSGVASSGTFVKNKNATWTITGVSGVPEGWTVIKE